MKKTLIFVGFSILSNQLIAQFNSLVINKLNVNAGTEANYTPNSGFLVVGNTNDRNLVFDANEILARTNGLPFDLRLQSQGGKVGIGEPFPTSKLHVNNGTTADLSSNSGFLQIGPLNAANLLFDGSQILSRFNGVNSTLFLQKDGRLSIGGDGPTAAKVNIRGGNDASLSNGTGYLVNGEYSGQNMVFDDNEIMVRNNGVAANLFLQNGSGNLGIGSGSADAKVQIFGGDNVSLANNTGDLMLGGYFGRNLAMDGDEIQARSNSIATSLILQKLGGNVGIGEINPNTKLHILGGTDASLSAGTGYLVNGSILGQNLVIDDNEIQSRNNNLAANLLLQKLGGDVGIGESNPNVRLHVNEDNDASLSDGSGVFVIGNINSTNLVFDANEILARDNALSSDFFIQRDGPGKVVIGSGSGSEKLTVFGNICHSGTIGACSDLRYKKDFVKIEYPLEKVLKMNGLHYYWKTDEYKDHAFSTARQIGFIAQEVEKIFPELVLTDANGYKSVDYSRLTPILVEAMKEQQLQIEALKKDNQSLKASIENRLNQIEALLKNNENKALFTDN